MLTAPSQAPQRKGNSSYSNSSLGVGTVTIVPAGSNPNGIIVRTGAVLGNNTLLKTSGDAIFLGSTGTTWNVYNGSGFLIPPGLPLEVLVNTAGSGAIVSYDIL